MDDHLTIRQKKLAVDGLRDYRPFLLGMETKSWAMLNFPLVVAQGEFEKNIYVITVQSDRNGFPDWDFTIVWRNFAVMIRRIIIIER